MFFPSPLTKALGVASLVLVVALGAALYALRGAYEDLGSTEAALAGERRSNALLRDEVAAANLAVEKLRIEAALDQALIATNEAERQRLETRVTVLNTRLTTLGATRYDPPPQLCPSADHQPTLDDLLDAPLPGELLDGLRAALSPRPGGAGGAGGAPGAADAPLPLP